MKTTPPRKLGVALRVICLLAAGWSSAGCETTAEKARPWLPFSTPKVVEPQEFVRTARPADPDFIPVSAPEAQRPVAPLTPAQLKAREAELAGVARRQTAVRADADAARKRTLARSPRPPKVE